MMRPLLAALALLLVLVPVAEARTYAVPTVLAEQIPKAVESGAPVLLPASINLDYDGKAYPEVETRRGHYELGIAGAADCGGANACFLARFAGDRGAKLGARTNVALAGGLRGVYRAESCGASCSPPSISWLRKGVRYEIQAKALGGKAAFVRWANSAIRAGARR